jgi:hypothetical protein
MDVCLHFSGLCCPVCRSRPCVGPITRPRSPTKCSELSNRFTSKNSSTPQGKRGRLRKKERKEPHIPIR